MNPDLAQVRLGVDLGEIKTVAIIDDIFDSPDVAYFTHGEIPDFITALENDELAQTELAALNINVDHGGNLANEQLQELWRYTQTPSDTQLKSICQSTLFINIIQDLRQVQRFCDYLRDELHLSIIKQGTSYDLDALAKAPVELIFIDYFLGPDIQPPDLDSLGTGGNIPAKERAVNFVKQLGTYATDQIKPLVILMSSKVVSPQMISQFRDETGWLEGMFCFIPKDDFNQKECIPILLGALSKYFPVGHKIQEFVESLSEVLGQVQQEFLKDIRTLSLLDYAYIQRLSLLVDGQPLGEYIIWLYGSYLNYLLFENNKALVDQCSKLDHLSFENLPAIQKAPSLQLARIYKSALFNDKVCEISSHPLANDVPEVASSTAAPSQICTLDKPLLHLGDIFLNISTDQVLIIINPQCDLAFSPKGSRTVPPDRSVILIQGKLQRLNTPITDKTQLRTELFEYKDKEYRILWDVKQVISYPFKDVMQNLKKEGFSPVARLRMPFVLEIQQAFASNLTRIGKPLSPPILQPLNVDLYIREMNGEHNLITHFDYPVAYLANVQETETYFLTWDLVKCILNSLSAQVEMISTKIDEFDQSQADNTHTLQRLTARRNSIVQALQRAGDWLKLLNPFVWPKKEQTWAELNIKMVKGKPVQESYNHQQVLLISLYETDNSDGKLDS